MKQITQSDLDWLTRMSNLKPTGKRLTKAEIQRLAKSAKRKRRSASPTPPSDSPHVRGYAGRQHRKDAEWLTGCLS